MCVKDEGTVAHCLSVSGACDGSKASAWKRVELLERKFSDIFHLVKMLILLNVSRISFPILQKILLNTTLGYMYDVALFSIFHIFTHTSAFKV